VDVTAEVAAVKVAEEAPAARVTDAGTATAVLLSERLTTAPLDGAAPDSATVQVLAAPPITVPGAHRMDESVTAGAVTVNDPVWVAPL
jgi:hypothetical protein